MTENETPLKLCRKWSEMAPGCFDTLDVLCRESHEENGSERGVRSPNRRSI